MITYVIMAFKLIFMDNEIDKYVYYSNLLFTCNMHKISILLRNRRSVQM